MNATGFERVEVEVQDVLGLHARAAAQFVRLANQYQAEIVVEKDGTKVNGKSVLGLLTLAAGRGSSLTILAVGPDSVEALKRLAAAIEYPLP